MFPVADTRPGCFSQISGYTQVLCFTHLSKFRNIHGTIELPKHIPPMPLGRHLQLVASTTLVRKVLQYDSMVYHVASPDIFLVSAENETRACSPDSQATEMIPSSIPSSPTIATASEMTHSAKSTERKFRAGAGEGVLFHYIYTYRDA